MATKYFCDICKKEAKKPVRVNWRYLYCKRCWKDKKKWLKIHEAEVAEV